MYVFIKMIDHPPSARKASRIQRRGRSAHLYYHKYKYRKKWKSKRSFRRVGMRHLGLRGTFHSISTPKLCYMSATLWIMFYIYKLLCWLERLVRFMPNCFARVIHTVKSHVLKSYVYARVKVLLSAEKRNTTSHQSSPDMQGIRYVCHMANNMSQDDITEAYAASMDAFLNLEAESATQGVSFDSDSFMIGVDTHATKSLSSNKDHFIGLKSTPGLKCQGVSDGVGQGIDIKGIGTLVFRIEDDNGRVHTIKLPGSLYMPSTLR